MRHSVPSARDALDFSSGTDFSDACPECSQTRSLLKRCYDMFFAGLGLALLSPLFLLLAVLIRIGDRGPVFYRQKRIGQHGRPFEIWKFRTMVVNADQVGPAITQGGDPRVTRLGRWLRAAKLDELPQLWNVFKGEMSLVGPRPEVPRYVAQYTPAQQRILAWQPGITDLATLRFRNEEVLLRQAANLDEFYQRFCIPRKIAMNLEYARQANILTDTWIILQTLCPAWLGVLGLYCLVLAASLCLSFWLHFDFRMPQSEWARVFQGLMWLVPVQAGILLWRRQCSGLPGFFSLVDMLQMTVALGLALVVQLAVRIVVPDSPSAGILCINFVLGAFLLGAVRMGFQFARERSSRKLPMPLPGGRLALIGAGELAANVAQQVARLRTSNVELTGLFDDDCAKWNRQLHGVPVLGMPELLLEDHWRQCLDFVLIAMPEAAPARLQAIERLLEKARLRYATVPSLAQMLAGRTNAWNYSPEHKVSSGAQDELRITPLNL